MMVSCRSVLPFSPFQMYFLSFRPAHFLLMETKQTIFYQCCVPTVNQLCFLWLINFYMILWQLCFRDNHHVLWFLSSFMPVDQWNVTDKTKITLNDLLLVDVSFQQYIIKLPESKLDIENRNLLQSKD